VFIMLQY